MEMTREEYQELLKQYRELLVEVTKIQAGVTHISKDIDKLEQNQEVMQDKFIELERKLDNHAIGCPLNRLEVERIIREIKEEDDKKELNRTNKKISIIGGILGIFIIVIEVAKFFLIK